MTRNRDVSAQLSAMGLGRDELSLIAGVARAHYVEERTLVDIAETTDLSRFKVARLLEKARNLGIVTIEVHDTGLFDARSSRLVRETLGLQRCEIVHAYGDAEEVRGQVAAAGARLLSRTLDEGEVLGLSWGRTLTDTVRQLESLPRLSVVQLTGVLAGDLDSSPTEVARQAAHHSGGLAYPIFAPLIAPDLNTASILRNHPQISQALDQVPNVTTALLSIGGWVGDSTQMRAALDLGDLAQALDRGCIGDIAGILIDHDGAQVLPDFQERCITITYEQLGQVPRVVAVAAGEGKAQAVIAAARAGLISELVADRGLAIAILRAVEAA